MIAAGADLPNRLVGKTDKTSALEAYLIEAGLEQFGEFNGRWQLLRRTGMLRYMLAKYNTDYAGKQKRKLLLKDTTYGQYPKMQLHLMML
ncbi:MAG: hypothetical protein MZV64_60650 [Ignavibacteriales bacterium]|nr:hypothetical protein [Ignavibacteriales bacterium]